MKKIHLLALCGCLLLAIFAQAQMSGNRVYRERYARNGGNEALELPVIVKDSILLVNATIIANQPADSLVVTLGVSQEAATVKECNALLNKRIDAFRQVLEKMNMADRATYIDFITQTKIYDYRLQGRAATQYLKGFEIKKNIIVTISAGRDFEKVIEAASEQEIYDVVKVDYICSRTRQVYHEMLLAAQKIIQSKKADYLLLSPVALEPDARLNSTKFYAVYPNSQYQEYTAGESSDVTTDNENINLIKSELRKAKTFYYEKIDQSTADLVVNNATPVVGIQYVLQIQMQYAIKKK